MPAMTTRHAASAWPGISELPATCLPRKSAALRGTESGQQVTRIPVFVKREDAYGPMFYYLGSAKIDPATVREVNLKGKSAVGLDLVLPDPLPAKIADQLFSN